MLKTLQGFTLPLKRERKIHINITDKIRDLSPLHVYTWFSQSLLPHSMSLQILLTLWTAPFLFFAWLTPAQCQASGQRSLHLIFDPNYLSLFIPLTKLKSFPLVNSRAFITNCNYLLAYAFRVYFSFLPSSQLCMSSIEVRAKSTLFTTVQGSRAQIWKEQESCFGYSLKEALFSGLCIA